MTQDELEAQAEDIVNDQDPPSRAMQYANAMQTVAQCYAVEKHLTPEALAALDSVATSIATRAADDMSPYFNEEKN